MNQHINRQKTHIKKFKDLYIIFHQEIEFFFSIKILMMAINDQSCFTSMNQHIHRQQTHIQKHFHDKYMRTWFANRQNLQL